MSAENGHIAHLLIQYAPAFTDVWCSRILDGHISLRTTDNGDLREVGSEIYGFKLAQRMLKVEQSSTMAKVSGLISPPFLARSTRNYLSFFINRRGVRSPLLTRATEEAYRSLHMDGRHPIAVVSVSLPTHELDVSIHPAKAQAKFCHEQAILSGEETVKAGKGIFLHSASLSSLSETDAISFCHTGTDGQGGHY